MRGPLNEGGGTKSYTGYTFATSTIRHKGAIFGQAQRKSPMVSKEATMTLDGKHALITGSSRGIGRGIALKLAESGVDIGIHYFQNKEAANDTLAKVKEVGANGFVVQADVSKPKDISQMFNRVQAEFGKLDIFVRVTLGTNSYADLSARSMVVHAGRRGCGMCSWPVFSGRKSFCRWEFRSRLASCLTAPLELVGGSYSPSARSRKLATARCCHGAGSLQG